MIDRRALLRGGMLGLAAGFAPRIAYAAAPTPKRFVFLIQRGAADGLAYVAPIGDPSYATLRAQTLVALEGGTKLDGMFKLHPALVRIGRMYGDRQMLAVHAVASVYRDRSHFDGQNVLESGGMTPFSDATGWMNRLIGTLPGAPDGMAISLGVPLAMRGPVSVATYAPARLPATTDGLLSRVDALYAGDQRLHGLWQSALATRKLTDGMADNGRDAATMGTLAATLLKPAGGARILMMEAGAWDTHSSQTGRIARQLTDLDAMTGALADGLGPIWQDTLVLVATEFGRTAAINGTGGTDHGNGAVAMLIGGGIKGGRVLADWPGLTPAALYQGRDLKPTTGLEAIISGALAGHFGIDPDRMARALYPSHQGLKPILV